MSNKKIGRAFEMALETIDALCDEGKEYFSANNVTLAREYFEYALSIAQTFARVKENAGIFEPVVARCLFYYSRARMNDTLMWESVLIAMGHYEADEFCRAIVDIGQKKFGFCDDTVSLLVNQKDAYHSLIDD